MANLFNRGLLATGALTLALAGCGGGDTGGAELSATQSQSIKDRQANFKDIGKSFKAIRSELEGSEPDLAVIAASADALNASAQRVPGLFPEGTSMDSGAKTEALSVIWEKPEEFSEAAAALVKASADIKAFAEAGDLSAVQGGVRSIGSSCKTCHDTFRVKKN